MDCPRCGGRRRPNIICFGENVPKPRVEQVCSLVDGPEASSLTVLSGYRFVRRAAARDIPIAIVNRGHTRGDGLATVKVDGGCSPIPALLADDAAAADCDGIEFIAIDGRRPGRTFTNLNRDLHVSLPRRQPTRVLTARAAPAGPGATPC